MELTEKEIKVLELIRNGKYLGEMPMTTFDLEESGLMCYDGPEFRLTEKGEKILKEMEATTDGIIPG